LTVYSMREEGWEGASFEGDGKGTNDQDRAAVGREEDSDEGPGAEKRGWCECENPACVGWVGGDSKALGWGVACV
jgi:hypothetical protein